jgi:UDP-N-acetylmuramoylalanine--D-glutamate ligase
MLKAAGVDAHLVGNVGRPPLPLLASATGSSIFIFEMSAQQLEHLHDSPHIAVLLNIVSDHLDHFATFEDYVSAKSNITRFQSAEDYLVFNAMFPVPCRIANDSRARLVPCSIEKPLEYGAFMEGDRVCWRPTAGDAETVLRAADVEEVLPGSFNLHNILPAVAVAKLLGVPARQIADGLRQFKPLAHRFDLLGTFKGIRFYNAPIATVPEVTIEHINALGGGVQTTLSRDRRPNPRGVERASSRARKKGASSGAVFREGRGWS